MRAWILCLLLPGAACTPSLVQGDRAFAAARYDAADAAWELATEDEVEDVLLRRAVLHAVPDTAFFDPAESRRLLEVLDRRHPRSPHGIAARRTLATLDELEAVTARLGTIDAELVRCLDVRDTQKRDYETAVAAGQANALKLEEERARLAAELKTIRDAHAAELQALRDENARLLEELEAMKKIDLRE